MKNSITNKQLGLAASCALALSFASGAVLAQNTLAPADERELWTDTSSSKQVWRNATGLCWHSAFGPPPPAGECNPAPVAQYVAPAPAPAPYIAPAPAQAQYVAPAPAPVVVPAPLPRKKDRN